MILSFRRLRNTFASAHNAFSQTNALSETVPVGRVYDVICDSKNLKLMAFWIQTPLGLRILKFTALQSWNRMQLDGGHWNNFFLPEEIPGLDAVFEREQQILNVDVYELNRFIGRVSDFSFDSKTGFILSLQVKKSFFFWKQKRIIARKQIIRIDNSGIYVSNGLQTANIVAPSK